MRWKRFSCTSGHKICQRISSLLPLSLFPLPPKQFFSILNRFENNPIRKVKIGADFLTCLPPCLDNLEMKINSCLRACEELIIALDQSTEWLLFFCHLSILGDGDVIFQAGCTVRIRLRGNQVERFLLTMKFLPFTQAQILFYFIFLFNRYL